MQKGFWNGEPTATFIGVTYEVTKSDGQFHWQNMHVGKRRQGIQITYGGETWIIDNEHGDGYYKVTCGMGSPRCGHKGVVNPVNIVEIPIAEITTEVNREAMKAENAAAEQFIKETDLQQYERLQCLKRMIEKNRSLR